MNIQWFKYDELSDGDTSWYLIPTIAFAISWEKEYVKLRIYWISIVWLRWVRTTVVTFKV